MRLTKTKRENAKQELLEILSHDEMRTSDLTGTPKFHGSHTLSLGQVRTLLHELRRAGKVQCRQGGQGMYTYFKWSVAQR